MIVTQWPYVASYTLRFAASEDDCAEEACLYLHGFPGTVFSSETEKGRDIAAAIAGAAPVDVFLSHYHGLGRSPGRFSFQRSIDDSLTLARKLLSEFRYRALHLVGHSWGGLVAMNLVRELSPFSGKLILLSPFNKIPSDDILRSVLKTLAEEESIVFAADGVEGAVAEIRDIAGKKNPRAIAPTLKTHPGQVTIIQALRDDEVPVETTREFVRLFRQPPEYAELDDDHRFSINRKGLIERVVAGVKNHAYG